MKKVIQRLIDKWTCLHQWEEVGSTDYYEPYEGRWCTRKRFYCSRCGGFKRIEPW
jgi:hypothetical protein